MRIGDTIFCKSESLYEEHISMGTGYEIHGIKENTVRIRGALRNRLVWLPKGCFSKKEVAAIKKIRLDNEVKDPLNDCIDVTISFTNGKKRWAWFTTLKYLEGLMDEHRNYIEGAHTIILKEVTKENVEFAVMDLYRRDELKQQTRKL